jgi:hypothetical protein
MVTSAIRTGQLAAWARGSWTISSNAMFGGDLVGACRRGRMSVWRGVTGLVSRIAKASSLGSYDKGRINLTEWALCLT